MPANPAETLLSPENHSLLMIDHQYLQMLTIRSHDTNDLINHAVALAEAAAIFKVPMLTTTAFKERQGLVAPLAEATKAVKPIDRTTLNSWEDPRIVDWVESTGRKKLVIAGQWTEVCAAMPVLSVLDAGYDVYVVTDACGGASSKRMTWRWNAWCRQAHTRSLPGPMCPNCSATGHVQPPPNRSPNCSHREAAPSDRACCGSGTC
jgi:nicotinamidase-related amidase